MRSEQTMRIKAAHGEFAIGVEDGAIMMNCIEDDGEGTLFVHEWDTFSEMAALIVAKTPVAKPTWDKILDFVKKELAIQGVETP